MATLTIRKLDDSIKRRLRVRAAEHGVSMEEEARAILRKAVAPQPLAAGNEKAATADTSDDAGREWHLAVPLEELMKLSVKPETPFDQKAVSDELHSYLDD